MSIRDALLRKPASLRLQDGTEFTVTRPSALDLIEAVEFANHSPDKLGAWLVARHLIEDGLPVFSSVDEVINECDAFAVIELGNAIESLYNQGKA